MSKGSFSALIYALNHHHVLIETDLIYNTHIKKNVLCFFLHKGEGRSWCHVSFYCRWSQNLAEQISPWRPKLPGGCKLCVCAHWPLLKRATAGLLLNVIDRGTSVAPAVLPPPWWGARCPMKYGLDILTLFTVPKIKEKKKETHYTNTHTHTESLRSPAPPRGCTLVFFFHFFSVLSRLAKNKD